MYIHIYIYEEHAKTLQLMFDMQICNRVIKSVIWANGRRTPKKGKNALSVLRSIPCMQARNARMLQK